MAKWENWFFYGGAAVATIAAIMILIAGPAEGAELDALERYRPQGSDSVFDGSIHVYEFTPTTASAMQCIFVVDNYGGSTFCWPKIMNDQFQVLIERLKAGER